MKNPFDFVFVDVLIHGIGCGHPVLFVDLWRRN